MSLVQWRSGYLSFLITQILIHCLQVSCIMFLAFTTASPSRVKVSLGPVLLISMLFQRSSLGDRSVRSISPEPEL